MTTHNVLFRAVHILELGIMCFFSPNS